MGIPGTSDAESRSGGLSAERLGSHLERIARDVERVLARTGRRDSIAPSSPAGLPVSAPPTPDGHSDLYLGAPGTALFFAALARWTGSPRHRELCLRLLDSRRLSSAGPTAPSALGALVGIGGRLYAHCLAAWLLDEPTLLDEAHGWVDLIDPAALAADLHPDVACGSAGAVLGLLALGRRLREPRPDGRTPLEIAEGAAERLLAAAGPLSRSGFSHGASGIAATLSRLARVTGRRDLAAAARRVLRRESRLYDPRSRRWRVAAADAEASPGSWCFGAPGLAIARLTTLEVAEQHWRAGLRRQAQTALQQSAEAPDEAADHLCCGTFGRIETLLYAYRRTGRSDLLAAARALTCRALDGAESRGGFRIGSPALAASLFRGVAGIGYTLLRFVGADDLPSPLAFEAPGGNA